MTTNLITIVSIDSPSTIFTKLLGKTPFLPFNIPSHQPSSSYNRKHQYAYVPKATIKKVHSCTRDQIFGREHTVAVKKRSWVQDGLWSGQSCPFPT